MFHLDASSCPCYWFFFSNGVSSAVRFLRFAEINNSNLQTNRPFLGREVAFVANEDHGEGIFVLNSEDLIVPFIEGLVGN